MKLFRKNIKSYPVFILYFLASCINCSVKHSDVQSLKNQLEQRISDRIGIKMNLPEVEFSEIIHSNAQYNGEKILIGKRFLSNSYFTDEDRLSILFHEYMHSLTEKFNVFQCKKDSSANIFQIKTNLFYTKYLSEFEVDKDISEMKKKNVPDDVIKQYLRDSKEPVIMCFTYAPSNLSKDELLCYYSELIVGRNGLFSQSQFYKGLIQSRIKSELLQFKLRLLYEYKNNFLSDGTEI